MRIAPGGLVEDAAVDAADAAERSGVRVVLLDEVGQFQQAAQLLAAIWGADDDATVVPKDVLRALAHSGNYVAGAFLSNRLVGVSVGFLGQHGGRLHLHSHVSGVAADVQHRRIGYALKQHQRAWSLGHGLDRVTWTFDPLVRRNAYFNLAKLGARVVAFHANFYGPMSDGVNAGDESDRAVVEWPLSQPPPEKADETPPAGEVVLDDRGDGWPHTAEPEAAGRPVLAAWIPTDILTIRAKDPELALAWRRALRSTLGRWVNDGYVATMMTRSGWYQLERAEGERTR